jgi:hypothetical protein
MSKRLLFTSLLSLITCACFAQKNNRKSSLTLSLGPSFPVGSYAAKSLGNDKAGFASIGEQVNISYDLPIGKYVDISFMLYGQRNGLNRKAMEGELSQSKFYGSGFFVWSPGTVPPTNPTYTTYPNWKVDKKAWLMGSALGGVSAEIPFKPTSKYSFIAKLMVGAVYVSSPKLYGESITDTAQAYVEQTSKSAFGVSYLVRAGIKYNLNKKWSFVAAIDHFATNSIKFKDVKATVTTFKTVGGLPQATQSSMTADASQTINALNLNVGISLRL